MMVAQAYFVAQIVSLVFIEKNSPAVMWHWFGWLLAVIAGRGLGTWTFEIAAAHFAAAITADMHNRLIIHIARLGPVGTARLKTGDLLNLLTGGIEQIEFYFAAYLPQLITTAFIPVFVFFLILPVDPISAALLAATVPAIPVLMILIGKWAEGRQQRQWQRLRFLAGHFLDVLQGLETLKLFGRSREQALVIERLSRQFGVTTLGVLRIAFLSSFMLELVSTISTAIVAVLVGFRLLYGHILFEQAFLVLLLVPEFFHPLRTLGAHFHTSLAGKAAAAQMYTCLELMPPAVWQPEAEAKDNVISGGLAFRKVSFRYPLRREMALSDVSFEVAQGERAAIIGPSGAGKSTVASLLLAFIQPEEGQIVAGGRQVTPGFRSQVTYLPQFPHVFRGTVAENLQIARPEAGLAELDAAAAATGFRRVIAQLPQGWETPIGEGGLSLSGGERQLLALTRAFLRDTPYLIMDEPTTALDPVTEAAINKAMAVLFQNKTVLLIAHRYTTLTGMDKIIVLKDGVIAETGNPKELMAGHGLYRQLIQSYQGGI